MKTLAIALCRVSSDEQLKNNSLNRQQEVVIRAAEKLDVEIPAEYWWSGSVSSKRGTNLKRKDIQEIKETCKRDKKIKYIIVDEPDRFMRSINEAIYFETVFEMLGVKVWYASDESLNTDDMAAKLMKFMKYFVAEGSNEERQRKSITGQEKALREGKYPFAPKPGYRKGLIKAVQIVDPVRGPILQSALKRIAAGLIEPSLALKELNKTEFVAARKAYRMDKFRKICTDPFYAGIVEADKQVKVRNINGLHEPLISITEHEAILDVFNNKRKNQSGPRKNGNPKYPLSNFVSCKLCKDNSICRFVGFDVNNGKNKARVYEKYRCRSCNKYFNREVMHRKIEEYIEQRPIDRAGRDQLIKALRRVWREQEESKAHEKSRLVIKIQTLQEGISRQTEAITDPANSSIREEILSLIESKKIELADAKKRIDEIDSRRIDQEEKFLVFALNVADNLSTRFLEISKEDRAKCKQLLFPAGFWIDENEKVYTPEMSTLYRLASIKKDSSESENVNVVRVRRL